jgi:hypothetical protein
MDKETFEKLFAALDAAGYRIRGLKEKNRRDIKLIISPKVVIPPASETEPGATYPYTFDPTKFHEYIANTCQCKERA